MSESPLLEIKGLCQSFEQRKGLRGTRLDALRDLSLTIRPGQAFGLVGESGSGKSTLAKTILKIHMPDEGTIRFEGRDLGLLDRRGWRALRREIQYVFQDPMAALDPRRSVLFQTKEPLEIHGIGAPAERSGLARQMLRRVQLQPDVEHRLPHELSGGQRQRVVLARALVLHPKLLICDEPLSGLDVSIQAQIVNLLRDLWRDSGLTLLFISHDLALVRYLCNPVAVLYRGRLCEVAPAERLFRSPAHPYTRQLLDAVPQPDPTRRQPPPALRPASRETPERTEGCTFVDRCPRATARCVASSPVLEPARGGAPADDHAVACHFPLPVEG